MKQRSRILRKSFNYLASGVAGFSAALGLMVLGWILITVLSKGLAAYNTNFFSRLPTPPGMAGGGLANAILGTLLLTVLAGLMGIPLGLLAGIYLSEFGLNRRFAQSVRFLTNILMGTPSIIIGIFVYTFLVAPLGHFSAYSGAVALAIMMLPVVARTTEDMLQMVPKELRESALALGAPRWRTTLQVIFRSAKSGLLTGVLLAVARVSGETAPLLFTALNSPYWPSGLNQPVANLTVTIFNYAMSPYPDWQRMAWGASLLITLSVLALMLVSRLALIERKVKP